MLGLYKVNLYVTNLQVKSLNSSIHVIFLYAEQNLIRDTLS
jgi:hypothetical protein